MKKTDKMMGRAQAQRGFRFPFVVTLVFATCCRFAYGGETTSATSHVHLEDVSSPSAIEEDHVHVRIPSGTTMTSPPEQLREPAVKNIQGGPSPPNPCEVALREQVRGTTLTQFGKLLLFGTGKQIPYDAGKYKFCRALENAKYFLAEFQYQYVNGGEVEEEQQQKQGYHGAFTKEDGTNVVENLLAPAVSEVLSRTTISQDDREDKILEKNDGQHPLFSFPRNIILDALNPMLQTEDLLTGNKLFANPAIIDARRGHPNLHAAPNKALAIPMKLGLCLPATHVVNNKRLPACTKQTVHDMLQDWMRPKAAARRGSKLSSASASHEAELQTQTTTKLEDEDQDDSNTRLLSAVIPTDSKQKDATKVQITCPEEDTVTSLDDYAIASIGFLGLLLLTVITATFRVQVFEAAMEKYEKNVRLQSELDRRLVESYCSNSVSTSSLLNSSYPSSEVGGGENNDVLVVNAETIQTPRGMEDGSTDGTPSTASSPNEAEPTSQATTPRGATAAAPAVVSSSSAKQAKQLNTGTASRPLLIVDTLMERRLEEQTTIPQLPRPIAPPLWAKAFALFGKTGTLTKLFQTNTNTGRKNNSPRKPHTNDRPTDCLNGMRVLSMLWIILGHTFLMPEGLTGYSNNEDIASIMRPFVTADFSSETAPWLMFVLAAEFGVDSFFFMSGFLLSLLQLQELEKKHGKRSIRDRRSGSSAENSTNRRPSLFQHFKKWLFGLFQRYVRLTPSLALALMLYYKVLYFFVAIGDQGSSAVPVDGDSIVQSVPSSGPFVPLLQDSIKNKCDSSWWSELSYTVNFIPFDSDKVCMGWSWYLGNDMLFFAVGTVIVPLYFHKSKLHGVILLLTFLLAAVGITTYLIYHYHLSPYLFDRHYLDYSYYAYSKPYCRIGAYLIGLATAWHVLEREEKQDHARFFGSKRASVFLLLAFSVLAVLIFIPATDGGENKNSWSDLESNLMLNFGRLFWAGCLAVIVTHCYFGHYPFIDSVLAHEIFTPLTRLCYGAYLCHPLVIKYFAGTSLQFYNFDLHTIFSQFLLHTVLSFLLAVVLWCLAERPVMTIAGAYLK
ncbi:unnamed protein product [Amoebophrya sp. A120]|nr:unnamed protein product [Amoebophrya sp. A120]|eukprot:GSA120T00009510001.1